MPSESHWRANSQCLTVNTLCIFFFLFFFCICRVTSAKVRATVADIHQDVQQEEDRQKSGVQCHICSLCQQVPGDSFAYPPATTHMFGKRNSWMWPKAKMGQTQTDGEKKNPTGSVSDASRPQNMARTCACCRCVRVFACCVCVSVCVLARGWFFCFKTRKVLISSI